MLKGKIKSIHTEEPWCSLLLVAKTESPIFMHIKQLNSSVVLNINRIMDFQFQVGELLGKSIDLDTISDLCPNGDASAALDTTDDRVS